MQSPKEEQEICVTCGLCCDGTLFKKAVLKPREKGTLPQKMEDNYLKTDKDEFFSLPCSYFKGKCSIYDQKKAHVCSAFRCQLLKDFSDHKITQSEALKLVENALSLREEVKVLSGKIFSDGYSLHFQKILSKIEDIENLGKTEILESKDYKHLKIKTIILQALLTRHFKSEDVFKAMIAS